VNTLTVCAFRVAPLSVLVPCTNAHSPTSTAEKATLTLLTICVFDESATLVEPCGPRTVNTDPSTATIEPAAKRKFAGFPGGCDPCGGWGAPCGGRLVRCVGAPPGDLPKAGVQLPFTGGESMRRLA
jgi:hypothetical protein